MILCVKPTDYGLFLLCICRIDNISADWSTEVVAIKPTVPWVILYYGALRGLFVLENIKDYNASVKLSIKCQNLCENWKWE